MSEILDIAAALSRLLKAENVLLICHKNPDGDTIDVYKRQGKGMVCHGLKGGIGSASRIVELDGARYTLGVLALPMPPFRPWHTMPLPAPTSPSTKSAHTVRCV